jgi:hypothetical protein
LKNPESLDLYKNIKELNYDWNENLKWTH